MYDDLFERNDKNGPKTLKDGWVFVQLDDIYVSSAKSEEIIPKTEDANKSNSDADIDNLNTKKPHRATVTFEWNDDLGEMWMNEDSLKLLLYNEKWYTDPDLLRVVSFGHENKLDEEVKDLMVEAREEILFLRDKLLDMRERFTLVRERLDEYEKIGSIDKIRLLKKNEEEEV